MIGGQSIKGSGCCVLGSVAFFEVEVEQSLSTLSGGVVYGRLMANLDPLFGDSLAVTIEIVLVTLSLNWTRDEYCRVSHICRIECAWLDNHRRSWHIIAAAVVVVVIITQREHTTQNTNHATAFQLLVLMRSIDIYTPVAGWNLLLLLLKLIRLAEV